MALRLSSLLCFRLQPVLRDGAIVPAGSTFLIISRNKSKAAKAASKKTKKDQARALMRLQFKEEEIRKRLEKVMMKVAKRGEPLDPEMLNPKRKRPPVELSEEEQERRVHLEKEWCRYKMQQHKKDLVCLYGMMKSRHNALEQLKKVSPSLYLRATELEPSLFPFERSGITATPPIQNYIPPDVED